MPSSVQSLEVSYLVQMTEDEEKVRVAVARLLGGDFPEEREEAEGHFGNKIVLVSLHLTGDESEEAFKRIVSLMDPAERRAVLGDLEASTDEHGALFIRLNKQALVMGREALLGSSDPVRVKVKPRSYVVKGDYRGFYGRFLGGDRR